MSNTATPSTCPVWCQADTTDHLGPVHNATFTREYVTVDVQVLTGDDGPDVPVVQVKVHNEPPLELHEARVALAQVEEILRILDVEAPAAQA